MLVWSYMAVVLQEIMKTPICQTEFYLYLHFQQGFRLFSTIPCALHRYAVQCSVNAVQGYYGDDAVKAIFTPRLGVEILNHFRITAYSRLGYRGYNNIGVSVGYAFGAGKKR